MLEINEYTNFDCDIVQEDINSNVFKSLKLVGNVSANGYTYTDDCLRETVQLYHNSPIFFDHLDRKVKQYRNYRERAGTVINPMFDEIKHCIVGDVDFNEAHPDINMVKKDILRNTPNVGFSHCVKIDPKQKIGDKIHKIEAVVSVDIVSNPATCLTFSESVSVEHNEIVEIVNEQKLIKDQIVALREELAAMKSHINKINKPVSYATTYTQPVEVEKISGIDKIISNKKGNKK